MHTTKYPRVLASALAAIAIVGLAGCSSGESSGSGSGKGTVGIVEFDSTSPPDAAIAAGAQAGLKADGWDVVAQDPKGDPGQANSICAQFVTRQVKALMITTFADDQMAQCTSQASAANIPVFYVGSPLREGMAGAIDTTNPAPINDLFIDYVKTNKVTDVFTLDYSPGTPCRLRAEYRDERLNELGVKVSKHEFPVPGQVVDSQNATAAWLAAHPASSGTLAIWSCFTDASQGAVAAFNQANRSDVPIFTWDFNKQLLDPIKSGQVAATLSLDGTGVGEQVVGLINGFLADGTREGLNAESEVLTADTVDAYVEANPDSVK